MPINAPTDVANCVLWCRASSLAGGHADTDPISQWDDESGQANHLTQTGSNRPTFAVGATGTNGHASVRLVAGSSQYFNVPNIYSGAAGGELFVVVKRDDNTPPNNTSAALCRFGTASDGEYYPADDGNIYTSFGRSARIDALLDQTTRDVVRVVNFGSGSGDWRMEKDDTRIGETGTNTVAFRADPTIGHAGGTLFFTGNILAVVAYSRKLTASERADVAVYLAELYQRRATPDPVASPTAVSDCILWLDAATLAGSHAEGDPVATWGDGSGLGNDATQATSARRPTFHAGSAQTDGLPSVRFNYLNAQHLDLPNLFSGATAGEIFVVARSNAYPPPAAGATGIYEFGASGSADHWPWTDLTVYDGFGSTARKTTSFAPDTTRKVRVHNVYSAASDWQHRIDNQLRFATTTNTVGWSANPKIGLSINTYNFDGDILAVVAYSRKLTESERTGVFEYLAGIEAAAVPEITTTSLPSATVDQAYSATVAAAGGTTPYTWAVTVGALPTGLSLNAATGEISGTPTVVESQTFTVQVTDDAAATDTQELTIVVSPSQYLRIFDGKVSGDPITDEFTSRWADPGTWEYRADETALYGVGGAIRDVSSLVPVRRLQTFDPAGDAVDEVRVLALVRRSTGPGSGSLGMGIAVRCSGASGSETGYQFTERGVGDIVLRRLSGGGSTVMATVVSPADFADLTWMRVEAVGGALRMRVWQFGTVEPGTWNINEIDGSPLGPGRVGLTTGVGTDMDFSVLSLGLDGAEPLVPGAAPATPELIVEPSDTSALLLGSAFFGNAEGETHASTTWQVTLDADTGFASPVVDVSTAEDLTALIVEGLSASTAYRARVRYVGEVAGASAWSAVVTFTTLAEEQRPNAPTASVTELAHDFVILESSAYSHVWPIVEPEDVEANQNGDLPEVTYFAGIQWQLRLASDPDWSAPLVDTGSLPPAFGYTFQADNLTPATSYLAHVRHLDGVRGLWSDWSTPVAFDTDAVPPVTPDTPTITIVACARLGLQLSSSVYSHPNASAHTETQWRVRWLILDDPNPPIVGGSHVETTAVDLLSITFPEVMAGLIGVSVRYRDTEGRWSDWSAEETCTVYPEPPEPEFTAPASGSTLAVDTLIQWAMPVEPDEAWRFDLQVSSDDGATFSALVTDDVVQEFLFTIAERANGLYIVRVRACYPAAHPSDECSTWSYLVLRIDRTEALNVTYRFADYASIPASWHLLWDDRDVQWGLADQGGAIGQEPYYGLLATLTAGNRERGSVLAFTELGRPVEGEFVSTFSFIPAPGRWYGWRMAQMRFLNAGNAYRVLGSVSSPPISGLRVFAPPGESEAFPIVHGTCDCNGGGTGTCDCGNHACCICAGAASGVMVWRRTNQQASYGVMNAPPRVNQFGKRPEFNSNSFVTSGTQPAVAGPARGASLSRPVKNELDDCVMRHTVYTMITRVEAVDGGLRVRSRMLGPGLDPAAGWAIDQVWSALDEIPCGYCGLALQAIYGIGSPLGVMFLTYSMSNFTASAVSGPVTGTPTVEDA